jgi:hypothetical protein
VGHPEVQNDCFTQGKNPSYDLFEGFTLGWQFV